MDLIIGNNGFLAKNMKEKFTDSIIFKRDGIYKDNKLIYKSLEECLDKQKINAIFNCAVSYNENNPDELLEINFHLPKRIIKTVQKYKTKTIFFGSFFEKGNNSYMKNYVDSKIKLSNYIKNLNDKNIYHLRLEHIYGKYDKLNKFIPSIIKKIKTRNKITLNSPNNIRDFTPVEHITNFCKILKDKGYKKNYINIGTGIPQSTFNFVDKLIKYYAKNNNSYLYKKNRIIEIKNSENDFLKTSFCLEPKLLKDYTDEYFKNLEIKTFKEIFYD